MRPRPETGIHSSVSDRQDGQTGPGGYSTVPQPVHRCSAILRARMLSHIGVSYSPMTAGGVRGDISSIMASPCIDDGDGLAGHVGGVVDAAAILDLARAGGAADLPHAFDLMRPALHVGFRQM